MGGTVGRPRCWCGRGAEDFEGLAQSNERRPESYRLNESVSLQFRGDPSLPCALVWICVLNLCVQCLYSAKVLPTSLSLHLVCLSIVIMELLPTRFSRMLALKTKGYLQ